MYSKTTDQTIRKALLRRLGHWQKERTGKVAVLGEEMMLNIDR